MINSMRFLAKNCSLNLGVMVSGNEFQSRKLTKGKFKILFRNNFNNRKNSLNSTPNDSKADKTQIA